MASRVMPTYDQHHHSDARYRQPWQGQPAALTCPNLTGHAPAGSGPDRSVVYSPVMEYSGGDAGTPAGRCSISHSTATTTYSWHALQVYFRRKTLKASTERWAHSSLVTASRGGFLTSARLKPTPLPRHSSRGTGDSPSFYWARSGSSWRRNKSLTSWRAPTPHSSATSGTWRLRLFALSATLVICCGLNDQTSSRFRSVAARAARRPRTCLASPRTNRQLEMPGGRVRLEVTQRTTVLDGGEPAAHWDIAFERYPYDAVAGIRPLFDHIKLSSAAPCAARSAIAHGQCSCRIM